MEFAKAVKMKRCCITSMWLPEALTLQAGGVQSCLILTLTDNESLYLSALNKEFDAGSLSGGTEAPFTGGNLKFY